MIIFQIIVYSFELFELGNLSSTPVFNINNNNTKNFRIISEGSCDADSWKYSFAITGINYILMYIKIEKNNKKTVI